MAEIPLQMFDAKRIDPHALPGAHLLASVYAEGSRIHKIGATAEKVPTDGAAAVETPIQAVDATAKDQPVTPAVEQTALIGKIPALAAESTPAIIAPLLEKPAGIVAAGVLEAAPTPFLAGPSALQGGVVGETLGATQIEHKPGQPQSPSQQAIPDNSSWLDRSIRRVEGAADIAGEVIAGGYQVAYDAVTQRPWQTAKQLGEGAAVALAIVYAGPAARLLGASARVVNGIGLGGDVAFLGMSGYSTVNATSDSITAARNASPAASILMDRAHHSEAEILAARTQIRQYSGQAALEVGNASVANLFNITSGMRVTTSVAGLVRDGSAFTRRSVFHSPEPEAPATPETSPDGKAQVAQKYTLPDVEITT